MTKFQRGLYENHLTAKYHTIWEAYERPSNRKVEEYQKCVKKAKEKGATDWAIPTKSGYFFSFSAIYPDPETGVLRMMYETKRNSYDFEI